MRTSQTHDAVVVGAGSAGASAALCLARQGLKVALLDRKPRDRAGARWINGLPVRFFDLLDIPRPTGDELLDAGVPVHLFRGTDRLLTVPRNPIWNVHMGHLVDRLHRLCEEQGVVLLDRCEVTRLEFRGDRPVAVRVRRTAAGSGDHRSTIRASLFVDASGTRAVLRRQHPVLARDCPPVSAPHLCIAGQERCEVADPAGMRAFLDQHGVAAGEMINWLGVEGSFSTVALGVEADGATAHIVTGAIQGEGRRTGAELIDDLKRRQPWLGRTLVSGARAIPLRRPYDRLAVPGLALAGDAACMVFPAHGSGVGAGMLAGKILADEVGRHTDPGARGATWAYQARYQREFGVTLASYDVLRRFFQQLPQERVQELPELGLINVNTFKLGLEQQPPRPALADMLRLLRGLARSPRFAASLRGPGARLPAVYALYRAYPRHPGERRLRLWSRAVGRVAGQRPDLG